MVQHSHLFQPLAAQPPIVMDAISIGAGYESFAISICRLLDVVYPVETQIRLWSTVRY